MDMCLKITWLRKILSSETELQVFGTTCKIDRLLTTDTNYHRLLYKKAKNPFWKSVISAYEKWYIIFKTKVNINIENQMILGNPSIKIPFNEKLYNNNIRFI